MRRFSCFFAAVTILILGAVVGLADESWIRADRNHNVKASSRNLKVLPADCVRRALLVGVNDYDKFVDLGYAVADVELIREKFLELGFKPEDIVVLKSGASPETLPTKENIEKRLDELFARSDPDDMIFIDFSGHGFEIDGVVFCKRHNWG